MDIETVIQGISFQWDSKKSKLNLQKHKINFLEAAEIFFDPFVLYIDEKYAENEVREKVIGLTKDWKFLLVVFTIRDQSVRIISARSVTSHERANYENR